MNLKMKYNHRSFTMIELLIVITILAILVSLISPSLRRISAKGDKLQCANNLFGIAKLVQFFEQDHGKFPTAWGSNGNSWILKIKVYQDGLGARWYQNKNQIFDAILDCPRREDYPLGSARHSNYAWNWCGPSEGVRNDGMGLTDDPYFANEGGMQSYSAVHNPGHTILIGPSWSAGGSTWYDWVMVPREQLLTPNPYAVPGYTPHDNEENLQMVDGSVRAFFILDMIEDQELWRR